MKKIIDWFKVVWAIIFNGEFHMLTDAILNFQPWNKRSV